MSRERPRYICLPVPSRSKPDTFVQIDPSRLTIQHILDLYVHEDGRYNHVSGEGELVVSRDVDPKDLLSLLDDQLDQLKSLVSSQCEDGSEDSRKLISGVLDPLAEMKDVFLALARGHVPSSADALTIVMSSLTVGLSDVTAHLVTLRSISEGMSASAEHFQGKAADLEQQQQEAALAEMRDWAMAAEAVFGTVSELSSVDAKVRPVMEQLERERSEGLDLFRDGNPDLLEAIKFLDITFTSRAMVFVMHPNPDEASELLDLTVRAGETIATWRSHEDQQHRARESQRVTFDREIAPQSETVLALCQKLAQDRKQLRDCLRNLAVVPGRQMPYQVVTDGRPLISRERYEAAIRYINDPAWYPESVRSTLNGIISRIGNLIRQPPKLSDAVDAVFATSKRYVDEVNAILDGMTSCQRGETDESEPDPVEQPPLPEVLSSASNGSAPTDPSTEPGQLQGSPDDRGSTSVPQTDASGDVVSPLSRERLDEIMEQLIAIAYARTCNPNPWASSSVKAMLRLLPRLNLATWDEVDAAIDAILTKLDSLPAAGEIPLLETIGKSANISERWESSRSPWIRYLRGGHTFRYKLTKSMEAKGSAYLGKHSLSVEVIKSLDEARRADEKQAYQERKAKDGG